MTSTTKPAEPSKEALAAAKALYELPELNRQFLNNEDLETHKARIIDSSFAELRRERDELREFVNTQCRCSCSPAPKAAWCPKCSILRRIKPTTPSAGRVE